MFTKAFWIDASERALKTFAQFFLVIGGAQAFNAFDLDWTTTLGLAIGGLITSYATSIVSLGLTHDGTPSLVSEKILSEEKS
jgi:hypothetical protein